MIKLNTKDKMNEELAKNIVGSYVHCNWHNRTDNTVEVIVGKVLDYKDGLIKIDTMSIFMLDDTNVSEENNKMIKEYNIENITDIFPFEENEYNHDVLSMVEDIEESDFNKTCFDIGFFDNAIITTTIADLDVPMTLTMNLSGKYCEFPLYFVKYIKKTNL